MIYDFQQFVEQSNAIEGIIGVRQHEIEAHRTLLLLNALRVDDISEFVSAVQPGACLRDQPGMNVRVGSHIPPSGGEAIRRALVVLLEQITAGALEP